MCIRDRVLVGTALSIGLAISRCPCVRVTLGHWSDSAGAFVDGEVQHQCILTAVGACHQVLVGTALSIGLAISRCPCVRVTLGHWSDMSLIHVSEATRLLCILYAVFC